MAEVHSQVVGPQHNCENTLPKSQVQDTDREKPSGDPCAPHAVLPNKASTLDQSEAAWQRYCANKTGADLTDNVTMAMQ